MVCVMCGVCIVLYGGLVQCMWCGYGVVAEADLGILWGVRSGSSKRQAHRNFQTDNKRKAWGWIQELFRGEGVHGPRKRQARIGMFKLTNRQTKQNSGGGGAVRVGG